MFSYATLSSSTRTQECIFILLVSYHCNMILCLNLLSIILYLFYLRNTQMKSANARKIDVSALVTIRMMLMQLIIMLSYLCYRPGKSCLKSSLPRLSLVMDVQPITNNKTYGDIGTTQYKLIRSWFGTQQGKGESDATQALLSVN